MLQISKGIVFNVWKESSLTYNANVRVQCRQLTDIHHNAETEKPESLKTKTRFEENEGLIQIEAV